MDDILIFHIIESNCEWIAFWFILKSRHVVYFFNLVTSNNATLLLNVLHYIEQNNLLVQSAHGGLMTEAEREEFKRLLLHFFFSLFYPEGV